MLANMSQWLTLSRAAHLLGVSRIALQKRIREGELRSFDGMVAADDLQRTWPELDLDESGSFEKTRAIREDAFARRLRERVLPTQEALARRLFAQGQELAELQRTLTRYHALFETLHQRLAAAPAPVAGDLLRLLDAGLARAIAAPAPAGDAAPRCAARPGSSSRSRGFPAPAVRAAGGLRRAPCARFPRSCRGGTPPRTR